MREIKFRGKYYTGNKWTYGDVVHNATNDTVLIHDALSCDSAVIDEETIGQYTDLKDKNGKEIYEGDIIHIDIDFINEFNYLIEWNSECLRYYLVKANDRNNNLNDILEAHLGSIIDKVEVIGNIYDNPELIKE